MLRSGRRRFVAWRQLLARRQQQQPRDRRSSRFSSPPRSIVHPHPPSTSTRPYRDSVSFITATTHRFYFIFPFPLRFIHRPCGHHPLLPPHANSSRGRPLSRIRANAPARPPKLSTLLKAQHIHRHRHHPPTAHRQRPPPSTAAPVSSPSPHHRHRPSLATCSNPTPARLAFRFRLLHMQGLRRPIA